MYTWREIKKQRFKCWFDQFVTNVNNGDERKGRTDTVTDWGDGEGKVSNRKDRKKQELCKAGIVTTRIRQ